MLCCDVMWCDVFCCKFSMNSLCLNGWKHPMIESDYVHSRESFSHLITVANRWRSVWARFCEWKIVWRNGSDWGARQHYDKAPERAERMFIANAKRFDFSFTYRRSAATYVGLLSLIQSTCAIGNDHNEDQHHQHGNRIEEFDTVHFNCNHNMDTSRVDLLHSR